MIPILVTFLVDQMFDTADSVARHCHNTQCLLLWSNIFGTAVRHKEIVRLNHIKHSVLFSQTAKVIAHAPGPSGVKATHSTFTAAFGF